MSATVHFVTGKGGVGKSTLAACLTKQLVESSGGPVLLIDVQGSGRALSLLGQRSPSFETKALPECSNAYGCRILPKETFKQYFAMLMSLGDEDGPFARITQSLRERLVDAVVENNIVSSFIEVCPGLEPTVLLGKIHWEATEGKSPEESIPWKHIVVDAPATGHGIMLFRSTFSLLNVFGSGIILRQATAMKNFMTNPKSNRLCVVTLAEELPIQESVDLIRQFRELGIEPQNVVVNRISPLVREPERLLQSVPTSLAQEWAHEVEFEHDRARDQIALIRKLRNQLGEAFRVEPQRYAEILEFVTKANGDAPLELILSQLRLQGMSL